MLHTPPKQGQSIATQKQQVNAIYGDLHRSETVNSVWAVLEALFVFSYILDR